MERHAKPTHWIPGVVAAMALSFLFASAGPALAAPPVVYHSLVDDGVAPEGDVEIPASATTTLHLYVDGGSSSSTQSICAQGTGDEICGFRLTFGTTGGLSLSSFVPAAGVDFHLETSSLVVLGGNPWRGRLGPIKIGDLDVQGPEGSTFELASGKSVGAGLGVDALATDTIVTVPEPALATSLIAGGLLVLALRRRDRRSIASRPASQVLVLLAAALTAVSASLPQSAHAQTTPVCGDVVDDDVLDVQDLDTLSAFLLGAPGAPDLQNDPAALARCDVAPNGVCDVQDYVRIRRSLLGLVGGMDETCTGALPSTTELPTPVLDQASTITTDRASVVLSGSARFPIGRIDVTGAGGRPWTGVAGDGTWRIEVPVPLGQGTWLSVSQDLGGGQSSPAADVFVNQTAATGDATLAGQVVDAATGLPLLQTIDVDVAGGAYQTDEFGRFEIEGLPEGYLVVRASLPGYVPALQLAYAGAVELPLDDTNANHVAVEIPLTPRAAAVTLDSAGGTIVSPSGFELVVPAGALAAPTDIALTELGSGPRHDFVGTSLVEIGPGPIVFDPPATLRIPTDPSLAAQTFDLLQVDDTDASVSTKSGVVASGFIEVPIESSNGDWTAYSWHLEWDGIVPGLGEVQLVTSELTGDCVADRNDKPFFDRRYEFIADPIEAAAVPDLVSDLEENPWRAAWWVASEVNVFGQGVEVPLDGQVTHQWTVTTKRERYRIVLDAYADGEASSGIVVGTLLIDTPQSALPNLLESKPIECKKPKGGAHGDPHLIRFDHVGEAIPGSGGYGRYDFQASGEFVLFESTQDAMVVQARFEQLPANPNVTITTMAAMDVAGDRVTVKRNSSALDVRIDGVLTPLTIGVPVVLPGGGEVERLAPGTTQDRVVARWPDGSTLDVSMLTWLGSQYLNLYPELAPARFAQVQGLLGNANGILDDDLVLRDGTSSNPAELYTTYTDSWRISQAESLFDYVPFEDTTSYNGTPLAPFVADDLDPAVRAAAEATCVAAGISEEPLLGDCVLDVALLGAEAADGALVTLNQIPDVGTYVAVAAQASIFQAGQPSPVDFGGGGGAGLLPTELALVPGTGRSMRVLDRAGNVSFSAGAATTPPDGVGFGDVAWGNWGDVAGPQLRRMGQLMGVFLDSGLPSPIPEGFDCGDFDGGFAAPEIGQVFCIGDGLSFANEPQTFLVPDAATRLFLGHAERLSSQVIESAVHHLGDNYGTAGLFALAPNPEGVSFTSNPFDLPTGFTPSSGRVVVDLVGTDIGGNSVWVNGQRIAYLPITGADITTWVEDLSFSVDPSILLPTGNTIQLRSNGGNLDDFLFQNLRFEVAPPVVLLPEPTDPTPYHLGCNCGQFIGDGVGAGNWGLFASMPTPYGTSWTSPPFDVESPETLGGASVVIDIAQTDRGNNLVLVNGTVIGTLPIRPDGTVWSTDEEIGFDPALLEETGNRIEVRSGYLVAGLAEVDDFMMRNARLAVAPEAAVPPGGYADNAGVHELIIEISP